MNQGRTEDRDSSLDSQNPDDSEDSGSRHESEDERLDRNWDELLQELRITQTGLQLLSGFLLTLPFTQVFPSLDDGQKAVYLALVVTSAVGVGANMTPIMLHRRVFREHVKDRVVRVGHLMIQVVMAAIALLIVGMATLIFSVVVSWPAGLIAGFALAVVLGALLALVPHRLKPE
jgi:hypothetical protein